MRIKVIPLLICAGFTSAVPVFAGYGRPPLAFEVNLGQEEAGARFVAHIAGGTLILKPGEAILSVAGASGSNSSIICMKFLGADPNVWITGESQLPGKANYFVGSDPRRWHTGIPTYAAVRYKNLYPGIDLVYRAAESRVEYDLILAPGARPEVIRISLRGTQGQSVDSQGALVLRTVNGVIRNRRPFAYQELDGTRKPVRCGYTLLSRHEVGLLVGDYDTRKPLVIDPILDYSLVSGGVGGFVAVDAAGNAYTLSGSTVSKLSADGTTIAYTTVIGKMSPGGIAVDSSGSVYVTGSSLDGFPLVNPIQPVFVGGVDRTPMGGTINLPDAVVAKLNPNGSAIVYSTYLGGNGRDEGRGITVDSGGNVYVVGFTGARDFPTTPGAFQPNKTSAFSANAFVSKINAAGTKLEYSTYLGGSAGSGGSGIAVDSFNNAYVVGTTDGSDFPTTPGVFQASVNTYSTRAFVTKLNAAGSGLVYSTYLGGSTSDGANAVAVNSSGEAFVAGYTLSKDFPVLNPIQSSCAGGECNGASDGFVAKLSADASKLIYSTYIGGSGIDIINAIAVDKSGDAIVTGQTGSADFPTVRSISNAYAGQTVDFQHSKAFVTEINAPGSALVFSTYLGGGGEDVGLSVALDPSGRILVAGSTSSTDFPNVSPIHFVYGGSAFVARIVPSPPATLLSPMAVSNGWPIWKYVLNDSGNVVFAGGDFEGMADGLIYSSPSRFFKFVNLGDAAPGVPGSVFSGFPYPDFGDFAFNDAGDVVFTANVVACSDPANLTACLVASSDLNGIFRYSGGQTSKIVLAGDPVPGRAGYVFSYFDRVWLNGPGDVVFMGQIHPQNRPDQMSRGLFIITSGQMRTIGTDGDQVRTILQFTANGISLALSDLGEVTFFPALSTGVFHYADGTLTEPLASGDGSPEGASFQQVYEAACNTRGDIVFHASYGDQINQQGLYFLRSGGGLVRILYDGQPLAGGGSFSLWYQITDRFGGKHNVTASLSPVLNNAGAVVFKSPLTGSAAGGLFLYDGVSIKKLVVQGDPRPDNPKQPFDFASYVNGGQPLIEIAYALNDDGTAAFNPGHAGLFGALSGRIIAFSTRGDLTPPIGGLSYAIQGFDSLQLNASGQVAFQAPLCCGVYTRGIFLTSLRRPPVPNGSFESPGTYGLPAGWPTAWANSGTGSVWQSEGAGAAAFDGSATLRLHVGPGGGSVFVVSDAAAAPVYPDINYLLECRMRFYFDDASDAAIFSVIQYDGAGNLVGFDEVRGLRGDSFWTWEPKRMLIHTAPNAAFIRYRFGLSSKSEKYLDIDAVH